MFTIADIWDWMDFDGFVQAVIDAVVRFFEWFRDIIWAFLSPLFEGVTTAVEYAGEFLTYLAECLGPVSDYLAFANAWAPVDVFFQCVAAYSLLWLALTIYRTVKSWIPTLSGS